MRRYTSTLLTGNRPVGECRLCREERLLCDSHLIPAGAFKALRADEIGNPNPVIIGATNAYTSSKQVTDYLLCEHCEARFRRNGEDWVLGQIFRPDGLVPLREKLLACKPEVSHEGFVAYRGRQVPAMSCGELVYFGMSVFWRAAAHRWPWQGGFVHIDVGPYLEPMRAFLLGLDSFPSNMSLIVRVSGLKEFLSIAVLPTSERRDGYHMHSFAIPGIMFMLAVGRRAPKGLSELSAAPSPCCYLIINTAGDLEELSRMANAVHGVKPPKGYAGL